MKNGWFSEWAIKYSIELKQIQNLEIWFIETNLLFIEIFCNFNYKIHLNNQKLKLMWGCSYILYHQLFFALKLKIVYLTKHFFGFKIENFIYSIVQLEPT